MKNSDVFFSVIIPTYNRDGFIDNTINSVLTQHFKNFELLVVDDGSTDDTQKIVAEFTDKRVRYFNKQNAERAAARNYGIEKARGKYITFLDSDDLFKQNHLLTAYEISQNQNLDIFHLGYDVAEYNGSVIYAWKKLPNPVNDKLIEGNFLSCLGVFIKREILLENKFNEDRELSGSEDYELWLRLAARFKIFTYPQSTAILINHEQRSVVLPEPQKLERRIELLGQYLIKDEAFLSRYGLQLKKLKVFRNIYLALHLALIPGSKQKALKIMLSTFWDFPQIIFNRRFWIVIKKLVYN